MIKNSLINLTEDDLNESDEIESQVCRSTSCGEIDDAGLLKFYS